MVGRRVLWIVLVGLCFACSDEAPHPQDDDPEPCAETPTALGFTEPGPWGVSAAELYAYMPGQYAGVLTWAHDAFILGLLETPPLDNAEVEVEVEIVLDESSVIGFEGERACSERIKLDGMLSLHSADGLLAETFEFQLTATHLTPSGWLELFLRDHAFQGDLRWAPTSDDRLSLRLLWLDDVGQTVEGDLSWSAGPDSDAEIVGRPVAAFEVTR